MRRLALAPALALAACGTPDFQDEKPTALDIAIPVGNGQTVFAVPNDASNPVDGGLFKIADAETAEGQNINAVPFECFDPQQPDTAIEELANEFIKSAQGSDIDTKLSELSAQAQDWYAQICHDL